MSKDLRACLVPVSLCLALCLACAGDPSVQSAASPASVPVPAQPSSAPSPAAASTAPASAAPESALTASPRTATPTPASPLAGQSAVVEPAGSPVTLAQPTTPSSPATSPAAVPSAPSQPAPQASPGQPAAPQPAAPQQVLSQVPAAQQPPASSLAAKPPARKLGEIVYEEGVVEIRRGERLLKGADSDIGVSVLSWDLVSTGPKSRVEIDLAASVPGGATIKLSERTAFYFDTALLADGGRRTMVRVLAGSVAFKVQSLGSSSTFAVRAGESVLGVRGTTFSVDAAADGSLLVSCAEGLVACVGSDGREFRARPGTLVEGGAEGGFAPKLLPAEKLLANRAEWLAGKTSSLNTSGADLFIGQASLLKAARGDFAAAVARLDALAPVLSRWESLVAQGRRLGPTESLEERKALAEVLLVCLKALPAFENSYYRLAELKARAAEGMTLGGSAEARNRLPAELAAFGAGAAADDAALGRIRRALYVFSRAEEGTPLGDFFAEKSGF